LFFIAGRGGAFALISEYFLSLDTVYQLLYLTLIKMALWTP
jgi:hypothetical protein